MLCVPSINLTLRLQEVVQPSIVLVTLLNEHLNELQLPQDGPSVEDADLH